MGKCKKVKFCYYLTFLTGAKTRAVHQTKIFVMKLKFYRVSGQQITDGIIGDRPKMADSKLYRQFEKIVKYDRIFKLFMDLIQL